jgi:hypothetical protein
MQTQHGQGSQSSPLQSSKSFSFCEWVLCVCTHLDIDHSQQWAVYGTVVSLVLLASWPHCPQFFFLKTSTHKFWCTQLVLARQPSRPWICWVPWLHQKFTMKIFRFGYCSIFRFIWQFVSNHRLIRLKRFVSWFTTKLCNCFLFRLHLVLHTYTVRFDMTGTVVFFCSLFKN